MLIIERCPSGAPWRDLPGSFGQSQGGKTSKIHAVVDTNSLPVRRGLTAGEAHDNRLANKLLSRLKSGSMLLAYRGYDADWIKALATRKGSVAIFHRGAIAASRSAFSPYLYRAPNSVLQQDQTVSSGRYALRQARGELSGIYPTRINTAVAER